MKKKNYLLFLVILFVGCTSQPPSGKIKDDLVRDNLAFAQQQLQFAFEAIDEAHKINGTTPEERPSPRNIEPDGSLRMVRARDWTSGFFPGNLWYMYELTNDDYWKDAAMKYTGYLESLKSYKGTHDLGFMMYCSYGNGLRLSDLPGYRDILLETAESLISRYNPVVGCIRSWDHNGDKWQFPVIIDNMMNLELLFWASKVSGDPKYRDIAVTHANTTMENHFRPDYSSFHVVDYNAAGDGKAIQFHTHQGYSHESAWARGQAWGLYGYTLCYRETRDKKYLDQAEAIANFILTHPNLPEDKVPYWDFDAPDIPDAPRDVSAGTITASALYELSTMGTDKGGYYREMADRITESVSRKYRAGLHEQHGFLTVSSTGHLPAGSEIDVPIVYGDYYFIESLVRRERLANGIPVVPEVR